MPNSVKSTDSTEGTKEPRRRHTTDTNNGWMMGMPKLWLGILNVGAVFMICVMFYQDRNVSIMQAKEDRQIFRAAVEKLGEASDKQGDAIRVLANQIQRLGDRIDRLDKRLPDNDEQ